MDFRTQIPDWTTDLRIDYNSTGVWLGSCFANNMALRMQERKFRICHNPFGVLFNPLSIARTIERLADRKEFTAADLNRSEDLLFSYDSQNEFDSNDTQACLDALNQSLATGASRLSDADYVVITFGSAWVYELKERACVVANCHKQPASLFNRRMLSVEEIVERFDALLHGALASKRILLTLSPVQHLREGFEDNSLSKATLRVAIGKLCSTHVGVEYFPAYEIMNYDLRDYRFYDSDMVHPSPLAEDYIWQKFGQGVFDQQTRQLITRVEEILSACRHRPLHPATQQHRRFMKTMEERCRNLQQLCPTIDLSQEIGHFHNNPEQ